MPAASTLASWGFQGPLRGEDENIRGLDHKTIVGSNSAHSIRINLWKLGGFSTKQLTRAGAPGLGPYWATATRAQPRPRRATRSNRWPPALFFF